MSMEFRQAVSKDMACIVSMLADDVLGAQREDASLPLDQGYLDAFAAIHNDPNNELIVVEEAGKVFGMMQLTFIPYLSYKGSWRCLIESVRIHADRRGAGLGELMINWAVDRAKQRDCHLVQLTSDKQRPDALRFYEKLGFVATHEGFKLIALSSFKSGL